jgi:hypothetical protein
MRNANIIFFFATILLTLLSSSPSNANEAASSTLLDHPKNLRANEQTASSSWTTHKNVASHVHSALRHLSDERLLSTNSSNLLQGAESWIANTTAVLTGTDGSKPKLSKTALAVIIVVCVLVALVAIRCCVKCICFL